MVSSIPSSAGKKKLSLSSMITDIQCYEFDYKVNSDISCIDDDQAYSPSSPEFQAPSDHASFSPETANSQSSSKPRGTFK